MTRPKGPELKMPDLKAPAFLADLYYDLHDRRLLPLIALVVVAIAAVPFLLGQKSESTLPPPAAIAGLKESAGETSALTVVEAKPGLRDYRKRLRSRKPTDPFRQPSSSSATKAANSSSTSITSESPTSTSVTTESSSPTTNAGSSPSPTPTDSPAGEPSKEGGSTGGAGPKGGSGGDGGNSGGGNPPHTTLYSFGVDVTIVHSSGSDPEGNKKTSEPDKRERVMPTTVLPDKKKQVATYMGLSPKTRKPLFLVSTDVTAVFGEGKCVAGTGTCQLIELEPGFPETFVYGDNDVRYKINVLKIELVVTGNS